MDKSPVATTQHLEIKVQIWIFSLQPQRDSNPCRHLESEKRRVRRRPQKSLAQAR